MTIQVELGACLNEDRELWRERQGDYYSDSVFVTKSGGIGINVGGLCIVKTPKEWHNLVEHITPKLRLQKEN